MRSALERLRSIPGQLVETDVQVDPAAELAGVYRHVGAGGTVMRPTRPGARVALDLVKQHGRARAG
ncbi:UbiD family decarboxylase, partial [Flavonifractor plautii]|nr:UbiD family decarboxylase [Flavonifractor plautii]